MSSGSTWAVDSEPTRATRPSRTMEMTVSRREVDTPLVVMVFPAQRSAAVAVSVTSTMVSSATAAASARSTT